jgi:hypothetical protein
MSFTFMDICRTDNALVRRSEVPIRVLPWSTFDYSFIDRGSLFFFLESAFKRVKVLLGTSPRSLSNISSASIDKLMPAFRVRRLVSELVGFVVDDIFLLYIAFDLKILSC